MTLVALGRETTTAIEITGIQNALAKTGQKVAFAIVVQLGFGSDAETIEVVTTATPDDRLGWFEVLGLPNDFAFSNDANYGVAIIDQDGEHFGGPNLVLGRKALANLEKYGKIATTGFTAEGETDPTAETSFAFSSDHEGWSGDIDVMATHDNRRAALQLYGLWDEKCGLVQSVTMGLAWRTPDGVTIATGSGPKSPIRHILHAFCAAQGLYEKYPFPLSELYED